MVIRLYVAGFEVCIASAPIEEADQPLGKRDRDVLSQQGVELVEIGRSDFGPGGGAEPER